MKLSKTKRAMFLKFESSMKIDDFIKKAKYYYYEDNLHEIKTITYEIKVSRAHFHINNKFNVQINISTKNKMLLIPDYNYRHIFYENDINFIKDYQEYINEEDELLKIYYNRYLTKKKELSLKQNKFSNYKEKYPEFFI